MKSELIEELAACIVKAGRELREFHIESPVTVALKHLGPFRTVDRKTLKGAISRYFTTLDNDPGIEKLNGLPVLLITDQLALRLAVRLVYFEKLRATSLSDLDYWSGFVLSTSEGFQTPDPLWPLRVGEDGNPIASTSPFGYQGQPYDVWQDIESIEASTD